MRPRLFPRLLLRSFLLVCLLLLLPLAGRCSSHRRKDRRKKRADAKRLLQSYEYHVTCSEPECSPLRRIFPRPWIVSVCREQLPGWVVRSLQDLGDRPQKLVETTEAAKARCEAARSNDWQLGVPDSPPDPTSSPREITRVSISEMSAEEFYENYISRGLPVVLTGFDGGNLELWKDRLQDIEKARREDLQERFGCEDGSCAEKSVYTEYREGIPHMTRDFMPNSFNFTSMVPGYDTSGRLWEDPAVFSGKEGFTFGDRYHFDVGCDPDVSVQYTGVKRWSMFSPVELRTRDGEVIPALTHFQTVVHPTDALVKFPGWFHNTTILAGSGDSIASVYIWTEPPPFGKVSKKIWQNNPFGFEKCAFGENGWYTRHAFWNYLHRHRRGKGSRRRRHTNRTSDVDHRKVKKSKDKTEL